MAERPGTPASRAPCLMCADYFITHDTHFPYGCRALNFKSRSLPHREVESSSGLPCQMFRPRPPAADTPAPAS